MAEPLPLSALLSQMLVAFIIEFDNEFEHLMPHRVSRKAGADESDPRRTPWLVSMVMWTKFIRFIPLEGVSTNELQQLTGASKPELRRWLTRLGKWWKYVAVEGSTVRFSEAGRKARAAWEPLTGVVENRWCERLGVANVAELKESLEEIVNRSKLELPDSLPILGYGLYTRTSEKIAPVPGGVTAESASLPALLSKVLFAFAFEFEKESEVSLAICANVLRLVGAEGVRVRELPRLAGISKEAVAVATGFLTKRGYGAIKPESPGSRMRVLVLNVKGRQARDRYERLVRVIGERWRERYGPAMIDRVHKSLENVAGDGSALLLRGLEPYADGWRASLPRIEQLPWFPMILHRGGYPDGS